MQKEKQESTRYAVDNVMSELLGPLDNLENALGFAEHSSEETRNWAMGFRMILAQFKEIMQNHGIVPFSSEGMRFDPHLHEAVEMEETDKKPEGTVLQEFIRGYKSGERIIRPARVKVAKAPTNTESTNNK
jgi:molecular chaperone GrpE